MRRDSSDTAFAAGSVFAGTGLAVSAGSAAARAAAFSPRGAWAASTVAERLHPSTVKSNAGASRAEEGEIRPAGDLPELTAWAKKSNAQFSAERLLFDDRRLPGQRTAYTDRMCDCRAARFRQTNSTMEALAIILVPLLAAALAVWFILRIRRKRRLAGKRDDEAQPWGPS